jgi:hypothetical protein
MSQKQKTPNLLEILTWGEFKLQLNERFTSYHLVFKDGMELLELTQLRDGVGSSAHGSSAHYVQIFNQMLIMVLLKEFVRKLLFMCGLKP